MADIQPDRLDERDLAARVEMALDGSSATADEDEVVLRAPLDRRRPPPLASTATTARASATARTPGTDP